MLKTLANDIRSVLVCARLAVSDSAGKEVSYAFGGSSGQAYHFDMQYSKRVATDLTGAGMTVFGDTRLVLANFNYTNAVSEGQALYRDMMAGKGTQWGSVYTFAGQGLHSLQDIFAHGNKGVNGIDTTTGDQQLSWLYIASHQGTFNGAGKDIDNPYYDWADCTLTRVSKVRKEKGGYPASKRYKSTEWASKAYLASISYEVGGL